MKAAFSVTLSFLFIILRTSAKTDVTIDSLAPHAIKSIIDGYFSRNVPSIELIIYNEGSKNSRKIVDIVEKLLRLEKSSTTIKLTINSGNLKLTASSIVVFASLKSFLQVYKQITWQSYGFKRLRHLVYIYGADTKKLAFFPSFSDISYLDRVDILANEGENSINLYSLFLFGENHCDENKIRRINTFERSTKQWQNSNMFMEKYKNFFGCKVKFCDKSLKVEPTMNIFTKYFKFTRVVDPKCNEFGFRENSNASFQYRYHFTLGFNVVFNLSRMGHVIHVEERQFFIPPGELYTSLEKMMLPFDLTTWILIGVTFLNATVIILVLQLCPLRVQRVFFDNGRSQPIVNLVEIFLSGSQFSSPRKNFARLVLTIFVIWSLIIRFVW